MFALLKEKFVDLLSLFPEDDLVIVRQSRRSELKLFWLKVIEDSLVYAFV